MPITGSDLERVPIEMIGVGEFVVSRTASGEPRVWQVNATRIEYDALRGQVISLKPQPHQGANHVWGISAPIGTLVHRVRPGPHRGSRASAQSEVDPAPPVPAHRDNQRPKNGGRRSDASATAAQAPRTHTSRSRWFNLLQDARFVLDAMRHQTVNAPRPNEFASRTGPNLWKLQPGELVRFFDARPLGPSSTLDALLGDVVEEVRDFLNRPAPWTTGEVANDLTRIVPMIDSAIGLVKQMQVGDQTLEDVIDELERDYLVSLAVTLTGQGTIAQKLAEWEQGEKGDYLDIATFSLVAQGGRGRLHMSDVHEATDAGITTYLIGEGLRSLDKYPKVQFMLYSQWFTYMYALWEESYRVRLAVAHGSDDNGKPWSRFDIRSPLFGDIRNVRNDVVHTQGLVDASSDNTVLTWFTDGDRLEISTEQMLSLVTAFPRQELLTTPARTQPGNPQNLPWPVDPKLVDEVRSLADAVEMTRKQRRDIGNEALRLWIAHQTD